jgi:DNA-binding response OmpR family regulator
MQAPFILVVEDDATLRTILARNLEARGYLVLQAGTCREAADLLDVRPALLVLDITLPDATGWDLARWLESITEPVPIVVISGSTPETRQMQHFHPVAFLPKPFTIGEFLAVVDAHLVRPAGVPGS